MPFSDVQFQGSSESPFDGLAGQALGVRGFLSGYINERGRVAEDVLLHGCCGHLYQCMQSVFRDKLGYDVRPVYTVYKDIYKKTESYGHVIARIQRGDEVIFVDGNGIVNDFVQEMEDGSFVFTDPEDNEVHPARMDSDEYAEGLAHNYTARFVYAKQHELTPAQRQALAVSKAIMMEDAHAYDKQQNKMMKESLLSRFGEKGIAGFKEFQGR